MKKLLLLGIVTLILVSGCSLLVSENVCLGSNDSRCQEQQINPEVLTINFDYNMKYFINIDCEYVKGHQEDNTLDFLEGTLELCKGVYPELWEKLNNGSTIFNDDNISTGVLIVGISAETIEPKILFDCGNITLALEYPDYRINLTMKDLCDVIWGVYVR